MFYYTYSNKSQLVFLHVDFILLFFYMDDHWHYSLIADWWAEGPFLSVSSGWKWAVLKGPGRGQGLHSIENHSQTSCLWTLLHPPPPSIPTHCIDMGERVSVCTHFNPPFLCRYWTEKFFPHIHYKFWASTGRKNYKLSFSMYYTCYLYIWLVVCPALYEFLNLNWTKKILASSISVQLYVYYYLVVRLFHN